MKRTKIVILNWNTKGYLRSFLPALLGSVEGLDAGVVVADNAGTMVDDPRRLVALKAIEEMPDAALLSESADYACLKLKAPDLLAAVELIRLHSLSQKQKAGSFYPSGLRISGGRYKI